MLLSLEVAIPPRRALKVFSIPLLLLVSVPSGLSQKAPPEESSLPKYDLHTKTKTDVVIDEVNQLSIGSRKDFTELIVKNAMTNSTSTSAVKHFKTRSVSVSPRGPHCRRRFKGVARGIGGDLARELVKGTDTLKFPRQQGNPVWDIHARASNYSCGEAW